MLFIVLWAIMSGYVRGGYRYERPVIDESPDRVISDEQAQQEMRSYHEQLTANLHNGDVNKLLPYFDNEYLGPHATIALNALQNAVIQLGAETWPSLPLAIVGIPRENGFQKAVVGDVAVARTMESWERTSSRGVTTHSAELFLSKRRRPVVFGDREGIIEVDTNTRRLEEPFTVDAFSYLPHIDGTTNYTVRHNGLEVLALGQAALPLLREHRLQHVWTTYLTQTTIKS